MRLERALGECTLSLLRRIAASHGLMVADHALRSELAAGIRERLLDPDYLPRYLASLQEDELELLHRVRERGWVVKSFVLERGAREGGSAREARGDAIPRLLQKGLLYKGFDSVGSWTGAVYHVPDELRPLVLQALPASPQSAPSTPRPAPTPRSVARRDVAYDLFCLLSFLRRERLRLVGGHPSRSDLARLEKEASTVSVEVDAGRWEDRWRFLIHLCLAKGWVQRDGATLSVGREVVRSVDLGRGAVQRTLLDIYLRDPGWSDLEASGRVGRPLGARRVDEVAARQLLVDCLERVARGGWVDEGSLLEWLRETNPDILREDYSSPAWTMVDRRTGAELFGEASWPLVEGEWVRYLLRGPFYWLGVVEWGASLPGKADSLRWVGVEEMDGAASAAGGDEVGLRAALDEASVKLEANHHGDLAMLLRLEPYLELTKRGDAFSNYRMTRKSVLRGLETGGSWEELRGLLNAVEVDGDRMAVVERVGEWAARFGRYSVEDEVLVRASDQAGADLLLGLPGVAECLATRLNSSTFLVRRARWRDLVERLRASDYPPRQSPSLRSSGAPADLDRETLEACLFAVKLVTASRPDLETAALLRAVHRLERVLGPEIVAAVARRVEAALGAGRG